MTEQNRLNRINYLQATSPLGSYSVWDNQADKILLAEYGKDFRWDRIFGETPGRFVRWESFDEPETEENNLLHGYAYPTFPFLEWASRDFSKQAYDTLALDFFGLQAGEMIPSKKLVELYSLRETVFTQLSRQAELCADLDTEMIGVLKVFWYETDRAILTNKKEVLEYEDIRRELIYGVQELTDYITGGISAQNLFKGHRSLIRDFACTPQEIIDSVELGLNVLLQKKEVIITRSIQLEERLYITEDLIRWALTSQVMLDPENYNKIASKRDGRVGHGEEPLPTREMIISRAHQLKRDGMTVENMFEEIKGWLLEDLKFTQEGVKKRFNFNLTDSDTFNRFVNKHPHRTN